MRINNAGNRKAKAIWSILSDNGYKVCVIGVTLTYPPDKVNGYFISGLGVPSHVDATDYMQPPDLAQEIPESIIKSVVRTGPSTMTYAMILCVSLLLRIDVDEKNLVGRSDRVVRDFALPQ